MRHKFFSQGFAYYLSGNTSLFLTDINKNAQQFADEINVPVEMVLYQGVIEDSSWCRNYQLYFAAVPKCPTGYIEVENYYTYIKGN